MQTIYLSKKTNYLHFKWILP